MEIHRPILVDTRKTCVLLALHHATTLITTCFYSGLGEKCFFDSFRLCQTDTINSSSSIRQDIMALCDAGKASMTYFPGPILVVLCSPVSTLHTTVENGNPAIAI